MRTNLIDAAYAGIPDRHELPRRSRSRVKGMCRKIVGMDRQSMTEFDFCEPRPERVRSRRGLSFGSYAGLRRLIDQYVGKPWSLFERRVANLASHRGMYRTMAFRTAVADLVTRGDDAEQRTPIGFYFVDHFGVLQLKVGEPKLKWCSISWLCCQRRHGLSARVLSEGGQLYWVTPKICTNIRLTHVHDSELAKLFNAPRDIYNDDEFFAKLPPVADRVMVRRWKLSKRLSADEQAAYQRLSEDRKRMVTVSSLSTSMVMLASELPTAVN